MFGTELIPLGKNHTDQLRNKIVEAILGTSVSRNSAVAFTCFPKIMDPELEVILHAIKLARRFLLRAPAAVSQSFLKTAAQSNGVHVDCRGPASVLRYYLLRFGWTVNSKGFIQVGHFVQLSLIHDSFQLIKKYASQAWQYDLLQRFSDRKSLRGLPPIARSDTTQILATFNPQEQKQLINEIASAYQTAQQQATWDPSVTAECTFCQQEDTKYHRVQTCPAVAHVRDTYRDSLAWLEEMGSLAHELPVVHQHENAEWIQTSLHLMPDPDIDPDTYRPLQALDMQGYQLTFYTDGSCMFPSSISTRAAAHAIVLDTSRSPGERLTQAKIFRETGLMPPALSVLLVTRTQGDPRIHRAELAAIVYLCERFSNTNVYSDSTTALSITHRCLRGDSIITCQNDDDFDLILRLWPCLQYGNRQFHKVKAHAESELVADDELYHRLGNKMANDSGIAGCKYLFPELARQIQQTHEEVQQFRFHLRSLYKFYLDSHRIRAELSKAVKDTEVETLPEPSRRAVKERLAAYTVSCPWKREVIPMHRMQDCACGHTLAKCMLHWMDEVRWPTHPDVEQQQNLGITWIELSLSFMLYTNLYLPVKRKDNHGIERLLVFHSLTEVRAHNVKLSEVANLFSILYKQLEELISSEVWPPIPRQLVNSLYTQGASIFSYGFSWRPQIPMQTQVLDILHTYLAQHKGPAFDFFPEVNLYPNDRTLKAITLELAKGWQKMSTQTHKAYRDVRKWRKNPHPILQFAT